VTLAAQFHGVCSDCEQTIVPGQLIERDGAGDWQHAVCGAMPARVECTCERCFLVHAGECF
jgi:hypothetical protein